MTAPVNLMDFIIHDMTEYKDKKIYLSFDRSAQSLRNTAFMLEYMFHKQIYVYGMASKNKKDAGLKVFHKQVVYIKALNNEDAVVIKWGSCKTCNGKNEYPFFNDKLKGKNIVVYGTGRFAREVCRILDILEADIRFFVDRDESKTGSLFKGRTVFPIDRLADLAEKDIVIEASYKWEEMEREAVLRCPDTVRFFYNESNFTCLGTVYALYTRIGDKKIFLYGKQESVDCFYSFYRYFDFNVECICCTETDEYEEGNIKKLADLVKCGNYILLAKEKNIADIEYFEKKGFRYLTNFGFADGYEIGRYTTRNMKYDINLGYTYLKDCKYPGIQVYGDEENAKYKIVCLGNSTTDGYLFPIKSWPKFLWEIAGNEFCIYNAGCEGYNVVQDFIKLLRDMLHFCPDMVIELSGVNETWWDEKYPFKFNYLTNMLQEDCVYGGGYMKTFHSNGFSISK